MNTKNYEPNPRNKAKKLIQNTKAIKSLGPVADLERHLPSDWWRTLFNSLYLKTDGDVVENVDNTQAEVDMIIKNSGIDFNDRILDLCCGQGRHSLELAKRGFKNVTGIDRSRYLIRLAKKRARNKNLNISFHEGDARKFRIFNDPFHCIIIMGNSFGYFDQIDDDKSVLTNVFNILNKNGVFILDVSDGEWMRDNFEKRSWEWIDQNHFVCRERDLAEDKERLISREVITHAEKGVIADQFYAERLYTKDALKNLLEEVGFSDITFHETNETSSTRGQDLGMMAHRLFLSARKNVKTSVSTGAVPFPKVSVLLGDPNLPDKIKKNGKFNEEDFDTINKLKNALNELEDFEFNYVDNHKNMIEYLSSEKPDYVFNLCDEGYNNDALLELHVPSLLEMLKIPYSGSGPACLGLCYNKNLVSLIAQNLDIPVPMETYIGEGESVATLPSIFPAIVKPNFGDSSIGITKNAVVYNGDELMSYIEWVRMEFGPIPILIQEFLTGPEYSIGIVGNPRLNYKVLPPLEVDYSHLDKDLPKILNYESKWLPDSPWWNKIKYKEACIDKEQFRKLIDSCNLLFERLGCKDYARFDFRANEEGIIKLLEVNPNPGWCWDGKLNIMAGFAGMRYSDLLKMILKASHERIISEKVE